MVKLLNKYSIYNVWEHFWGESCAVPYLGDRSGIPFIPSLFSLLPRLPICSDTPHFYPCFVPSFSSINSKFGFNSGENLTRTSHGWKNKKRKKKKRGKSHNVRRKLQQFEDQGINILGIEPFNHFTLSKVHAWKLIYINKFIQIQELIVYIAEFSKCKIDNS